MGKSDSLSQDASTRGAGLAELCSLPRVEQYSRVRRATEALCEPLETEDFVVQSMPDASPTRWHLAHTTWFFETFVLVPYAGGYRPFDPAHQHLFNSYYNQIGVPFERARRGALSRPTVKEVFAYRHYVDDAVRSLLESAGERARAELDPLVEIGLHHEEQHQELILTDIKHAFGTNPIHPPYRVQDSSERRQPGNLRFEEISGGVIEIGRGPEEKEGFAYDNERPRHRVYLEPCRIASRLVTNGEFLDFIADRGYERPELWLSDGWDAVRRESWSAPLYWTLRDGEWHEYTLVGERPVDRAVPVAHVSYYEADAFARWAGARLPTEAEWEHAASRVSIEGNFVESGLFHPAPPVSREDCPPLPGIPIRQLFGDLWEWTSSAYSAYPGYSPPAGALGEYNAKFMSNRFVLRGGSCATPRRHIRPTYRNFFTPDVRWQFAGIRLAR